MQSPLNSKQQEAVEYTKGPLLVLAGPGSGKTRTLTHRLAHIIRRGTPSDRILAVTFTNKAADEMRRRTEALVGRRVPWVGTFHSVCARILRREAALLGYTPSFSIYDEDDQASLVRELMHEEGISPKEFSPRAIANIIAEAKERSGPPSKTASSPTERVAAALYSLYNDALRARNAMDFADLLVQTIALWQKYPRVLARYQNQFSHILVDEYQDTNHAQYTLVKMLGGKHGNVCVVGDDSQSIYSWRGADFRNILDFEKDWPNAHVVVLDQNYRSTQTILDAASSLIGHNTKKKDKNLWTEGGRGEPLVLREAHNEREEARAVCDTVKNMSSSGKTKLDECVVLYRTNAQSRVLEEACMEEEIPYVIVGGVAFYARKEVKDVLAYLRAVANPRDRGAILRIINTPPRGIGTAGIASFKSGIPTRSVSMFAAILDDLRKKDREAPARIIEHVLTKTAYEEYIRDGTEEGEARWDNIGELVAAAEQFGTLYEFLEHVALVQAADTKTTRGRLTLMTMHAAKGLEFDHVFIVGCEEDILPHSRSAESQDALEEERRLYYVALTRARLRVYCSFAQRRALWGTMRSNPPSRFLFEMPEHTLVFESQTKSYETSTIEWD